MVHELCGRISGEVACIDYDGQEKIDRMMTACSVSQSFKHPTLYRSPFISPLNWSRKLNANIQLNVESLEKKNYVRQPDQTTPSTFSSNRGI